MPDPSVTLITGASRGVGEALALRLAHDGRTVAALSRNAEKLAALAAQTKDAPGTIIPCPADVRDASEVAACVNSLEQEHGQVAVLVNNAAVVQNIPFADQPDHTIFKRIVMFPTNEWH